MVQIVTVFFLEKTAGTKGGNRSFPAYNYHNFKRLGICREDLYYQAIYTDCIRTFFGYIDSVSGNAPAAW